LILRGSTRWSGSYDTSSDFQTPWWDLPHNLEGKSRPLQPFQKF
jgi:hypothetical protein